ncbi:MAG: hypothetical protein Tsb005_03040 [Gammaproteobacteria bacterium]
MTTNNSPTVTEPLHMTTLIYINNLMGIVIGFLQFSTFYIQLHYGELNNEQEHNDTAWTTLNWFGALALGLLGAWLQYMIRSGLIAHTIRKNIERTSLSEQNKQCDNNDDEDEDEVELVIVPPPPYSSANGVRAMLNKSYEVCLSTSFLVLAVIADYVSNILFAKSLTAFFTKEDEVLSAIPDYVYGLAAIITLVDGINLIPVFNEFCQNNFKKPPFYMQSFKQFCKNRLPSDANSKLTKLYYAFVIHWFEHCVEAVALLLSLRLINFLKPYFMPVAIILSVPTTAMLMCNFYMEKLFSENAMQEALTDDERHINFNEVYLIRNNYITPKNYVEHISTLLKLTQPSLHGLTEAANFLIPALYLINLCSALRIIDNTDPAYYTLFVMTFFVGIIQTIVLKNSEMTDAIYTLRESLNAFYHSKSQETQTQTLPAPSSLYKKNYFNFFCSFKSANNIPRTNSSTGLTEELKLGEVNNEENNSSIIISSLNFGGKLT